MASDPISSWQIEGENVEVVRDAEKQKHYSTKKGPCSQDYGFPVVMYGCESWTIKKVEH